MTLAEHDLDASRGSLLVRQGKGGKGREVGMDDWGFEPVRPWLGRRMEMPGRDTLLRDRRTDAR